MKVGQTVYTINNKTNNVDSWTYAGVMRVPDELLIRLERGKEYCYLPSRCVYESKLQAQFIAKSYQ